MNKEHIKNLRTLANYLKGEIKVEFDMEWFSSTGNTYETKCGTSGCAIGHGPHAGIKKKKWETWLGYGERVFGISSDFHRSLFHFLFGNYWSDFDNTPKGAAKRIDYFLEKGFPKELEKLEVDKDEFYDIGQEIVHRKEE